VGIDFATSYISVAMGNTHGCAITVAGVLKCWGSNNYGQVGDGSTTLRDTPVVIDSGMSYAFVAVGQNHTCAITTANALKCWGYNSSGQLGDGATMYIGQIINEKGEMWELQFKGKIF
jgi:uncharacterized protein YdiU (UPF0061 family)